MSTDPIVIVAARRTPIGAFQGALSKVKSTDLAATAIGAVHQDSGINDADIDEVILGCVLPAGQGQAPARQATLAAGLPSSVGATTLNKVCGSGMKAIMLAHDTIAAGSADIIIAGGSESMSNAPYLLPKARSGYRMGHQQVLDHMFYDGLQNPYDDQMMGIFGDLCAEHYHFTREDQDAFAIESTQRARTANESGAFNNEIAPVTVKTRKSETVVEQDEEPFKLDTGKIPKLRAAFKKDGTVTAASSSSISDGAAAVMLMRASEAHKRGLTPLAAIDGHAGFAHEPEWFTTAPVGAIKKLQGKLDWATADVDLYEVNEAFAAVTMAAIHDLKLDADKVNVNGGACALGHPIGCSGARILVTLIHALRARNGQRGIASLCIGGGEATAIAVHTA